MKISICMPVMGREKMTAQAIHSILAQGYDDFELVIKDGSENNAFLNSPEFLRVANCVGSRLNYACGKDNGIFDAANHCFKRVTGDIFYFMCNDDLLCPGAFASVKEAFEGERFGGAYWIYGQCISADSEGRKQGIDGLELPAQAAETMKTRNCLGQPSVFWNRQMYDLVGGFDPRLKYAADYDLWLRFWKLREPGYVNRELGIFRHHPNQDTELNRQRVEDAADKIALRHAGLGGIIARARRAHLQKLQPPTEAHD